MKIRDVKCAAVAPSQRAAAVAGKWYGLGLLWLLWSCCGWADGLAAPSEADASFQPLVLTDACIRLPLPGQTTAVVYLTVANSGQQPIVIEGVDVAGAARAELHQHLHQDGMMRMRKVTAIEVPAQQSVAFEPGGYHIMAFNLQPVAASADGYRVTLQLAGGRSLSRLVQADCDAGR